MNFSPRTAPPPCKVLVVDDEPLIRLNLGALLEDQGYQVIEAGDGAEGFEMVKKELPDLVLTDLRMPVMDGLELITLMHKHFPETPVVVISGNSAIESAVAAVRGGAWDYLTKPVEDLAGMEIILSRALEKARLMVEVRNYREHLEDLIHERTRELILTQDAAILGLAILAEYRDLETGEHIRRTQLYVRLIAEKLKDQPCFQGYFDKNTMRLLYNSAPLHDIGKVGVPDCILQKPGQLTATEFDSMKRHTLFGRDVIRRIETNMHDHSASSFLRFAEELAHTHHEHWDGSGYHGLKGEEIPISGRIMAVADIYDALTSTRIYKPAYSHDESMKIITEGDGRTCPTHFDPVVLQAFIDLSETFRSISSKTVKPVSTGHNSPITTDTSAIGAANSSS